MRTNKEQSLLFALVKAFDMSDDRHSRICVHGVLLLKKSCPNLYCNLLYKLGQDCLNIHVFIVRVNIYNRENTVCPISVVLFNIESKSLL